MKSHKIHVPNHQPEKKPAGSEFSATRFPGLGALELGPKANDVRSEVATCILHIN
jgi:hypothetical protein